MGIAASLSDFSADGDAVAFGSYAANIANSGQGNLIGSSYVALRSDTGWKTLADLNGPSGSVYTVPDGVIFPLVPCSSRVLIGFPYLVVGSQQGERYDATVVSDAGPVEDVYLRNPDGTFTQIGKHGPFSEGIGGLSGKEAGESLVGASDDLSHVFVNGANA